MAIAAVYVKGPPERLVYINGGEVAEGRTNKHYAFLKRLITFAPKQNSRDLRVA